MARRLGGTEISGAEDRRPAAEVVTTTPKSMRLAYETPAPDPWVVAPSWSAGHLGGGSGNRVVTVAVNAAFTATLNTYPKC